MRKLFRMIIIAICSTVVIYFGLAFGLILSQRTVDLSTVESISFSSVTDQPPVVDVPITSIPAEDGSPIRYRHFPPTQETAPLVIVIHGSGWHGEAYLDLASALSNDGEFEVIVPDLRGHGVDPIRRGDVDYIGQFEDDLATLIAAHGGESRKVAMVGHSSGGGLIIRFAGGSHGALLDRAVLVAPFLHHSAPTFRENAGGWAHPLVRRIIGLSMLNRVGITAFNNTTIMQFNYPDAVLEGPQGHTATEAYSYRLNASFSPRDDYLSDIAKLPKFLLIAGADDDAFWAEQYEPTMRAASAEGTYHLLPAIDHIGIVRSSEAYEEIIAFLRAW